MTGRRPHDRAVRGDYRAELLLPGDILAGDIVVLDCVGLPGGTVELTTRSGDVVCTDRYPRDEIFRVYR